MDGFNTDRLLVRRYRETDLLDFHTVSKSPHVGPAAGWKPHETLEESRGILEAFIRGEEVFALEERATGRVIGSLGLHKDLRRHNADAWMVGYVLAETHWGKGLMTEAVQGLLQYGFRVKGASVLSVYHYPENHGSRRVIEKVGFQREGVLRRATRIYDGTLRDDVCYSMLPEEFEALYGGASASPDRDMEAEKEG